MNYFYLKQLPVLPPAVYSRPVPWAPGTLEDWIRPRVLELTYTAEDMRPFAKDMGYDGDPFPWDEERRFTLRCELDAAFFHLYLPSTPDGRWIQAEGESDAAFNALQAAFPTPRDAVAHIMESFPIVKKNDLKAAGLPGGEADNCETVTSWRTRDTILHLYDQYLRDIGRQGGAIR